MKHHTRLENRQGFTLIELMVVIGIIGLLISILIPTVGKVRGIARSTVTQALMNRMDTAIQQYYADNNSYPGVFSNAEISEMQDPAVRAFPVHPVLGPLKFYYWKVDPAIPTNSKWTADTVPAPRTLTSSENMYLAMIGGLHVRQPDMSSSLTARTTETVTPEFNYRNDPLVLDTGNISLNLAKPRKGSPYLPLKLEETTAVTMPARFYDPSQWKPGYSSKYDTVVPEIVDGFAGQNPILYLRAMRGTGGIVSARDADLKNPNDTSSQVKDRLASSVGSGPLAESHHYNSYHLEPYGFPSPDPTLDIDGRVKYADYQTYFPDYPDNRLAADPWYVYKGDQRYFANLLTAKPWDTSSPPSSLAKKPVVVSANEPAHKDTYILISAGLDGKFGTKDDITNFK